MTPPIKYLGLPPKRLVVHKNKQRSCWVLVPSVTTDLSRKLYVLVRASLLYVTRILPVYCVHICDESSSPNFTPYLPQSRYEDENSSQDPSVDERVWTTTVVAMVGGLYPNFHLPPATTTAFTPVGREWLCTSLMIIPTKQYCCVDAEYQSICLPVYLVFISMYQVAACVVRRSLVTTELVSLG